MDSSRINIRIPCFTTLRCSVFIDRHFLISGHVLLVDYDDIKVNADSAQDTDYHCNWIEGILGVTDRFIPYQSLKVIPIVRYTSSTSDS